jgi:hypothetical protein
MTIERFPLISIGLGVALFVGDETLLPIDKVISS